MTVDKRERELFQIASSGPPITNDFLDEFTDPEELCKLGLSLGIRRLIMIICGSDTAPKDIIPAARLIFQLNGKDVGEGADDTGLTRAERERVTAELQTALARSEKAGQ